MINKIRNLFKKIIKDKKDISSQDDDQLDEIIYEDEDATGEVQIQNLNTAEDSTGDVPAMPSEYYVEEDNQQTGSFSTGTIDLENGKLPIKVKFQMALSNAKNALHTFKINKPKKMKISKEGSDNIVANITQKISLPEGFQNVEKNIKKKLIKVNWRNIHNDFFHERNRQLYHRLFQYTAVICITFALGKSVGLLLTGVNDYKVSSGTVSLDIDKTKELLPAQVNQIKTANLFKTDVKEVEGPKKPVVKTNIACTQASKKSRLPIKLVNTIVLQDSVKSIASVQLRSENLLQEFRVGEKINGMAQIDRIERQKLIVKNLQDGSCESIENEDNDNTSSPIAVMTPKQSKQFVKTRKKIKGIENDGNSFTVEKSFLKSKMANVSDILTQARGIQINNPDGTISFKIVDIEPGGVFAYLGIENNDIITQINGQPISDLNTVMNLFSKITNIDQLALKVKRSGNEVPLEYKFK